MQLRRDCRRFFCPIIFMNEVIYDDMLLFSWHFETLIESINGCFNVPSDSMQAVLWLKLNYLDGSGWIRNNAFVSLSIFLIIMIILYIVYINLFIQINWYKQYALLIGIFLKNKWKTKLVNRIRRFALVA